MEKEQNTKGYRKLIVHQKADELAFQTYQATNDYPKDELFGLTSQMRRCAVSVPANIAEGYMRSGTKEKVRFYNIAQASLVELEYYLDFSERLGYLKGTASKKLKELKDDTGKLLNGYIRAIRNNTGNMKQETGV
jgi:four helix bundle protein